jgi:L-ascorbate metabolism protein UlaG (beta-lactamase superfamily)
VRAIAAGERIQVGAVAITAARAKHVGARYAVDRWRGEAYMYLIDDGECSVLFTGDTSLTPIATSLAHLISPRRVDVALLPIGYAPWWKRYLFRRGHLTPADALELFTQVNARTLVPFHWGTFRHVTSGAYDAINVFRSLLPAFARNSDVIILKPGETLRMTASDR